MTCAYVHIAASVDTQAISLRVDFQSSSDDGVLLLMYRDRDKVEAATKVRTITEDLGDA